MKSIKVFGAALDPSDSETKIMIKQAHIDALANRTPEKSKYLDPYEAFIAESKVLTLSKFQKIGKFPIESWLCPKPYIEDHIFMTPLNFRLFLDKNGCQEYAQDLEKYIEQKVLPDAPLMIGADHSLTGGVLRALSRKYGSDKISVIVFDGHFDAIPTNLRLALASYSKEHKDELALPFPEFIDSIDEQTEIPRSYNCGTFLYHLVQEKVILPQNLIVFGCVDYPNEALKAIPDPRVKEFVDFYLSYEKNGAKIIPNFKDNAKMQAAFKRALDSINTPYLYISMDVDVGALNEILAARFMEFIGVDSACLNNIADLLRSYLITNKVVLIGVDIMEVEVFYLNAKLKSGKVDRTIEIMDYFLDKIF
ncbi:MAG: arginase family protein [Candidatus Helarchaeota archaeon]|nr:arginase family protein [Candidatus Helarchaeota archaeon]